MPCDADHERPTAAVVLPALFFVVYGVYIYSTAVKLEPFAVKSYTVPTVVFFLQTMSFLSTARFTQHMHQFMVTLSSGLKDLSDVANLQGASTGESGGCRAVALAGFVPSWCAARLASTRVL